MKIGFSSSICPDWDLPTLVEKARTMGYEALELCTPQDGRPAPAWPGQSEAASAKQMLAEAGIELTCLATSYSLHWADRRTLHEQKNSLVQTIELAAHLGCRHVSMKTGSVPRLQRRDNVLLRLVKALREVASRAADHRVTLLVENDGNLGGSRDIWFILDAASHPSVRCCWNPVRAAIVGNSTTLAVPRIGRHVRVTHMADAVFAADGSFQAYAPLGQGHLDLDRYLVLMKGIGSDSRLIVHEPASNGSPQAEEMLPASLAWIKEQLSKIAETPELTAYKGDKNAPRYAPVS